MSEGFVTRATDGDQFTMRDLSILLTEAFRKDIDPDTPVYANVSFSMTTPAPVTLVSIGKEK